MNLYGDSEPEDAWDAADPTPILLENLRRRLTILEQGITPEEQLDVIRRRLGAVRIRILTDAEQIRVDLIAEDVEFLLGRLEDEDPRWAPSI